MRKALTPLGETEMEILHIVWDLKKASVADVRKQILKKREVAYTTVMTVLKNLSDKGYLSFDKKGLSYIYRAKINPEDVRFSLIDMLVNKVFHGSPGDLVQALVLHENLSDEEREEIKSIINKMED